MPSGGNAELGSSGQPAPRKRGLLEISCMVLFALGFAFGLIPLAGSIFKIAFGAVAAGCGIASLLSASKGGFSRDNLVLAFTIASSILTIWGIASIIGTVSLVGGLGGLLEDGIAALKEWLAGM